MKFIAICFAGGLLFAQTGKQEVFGSVGYAKSYDDEGSIGKGLAGNGGYSYRLTRKWAAEGEYSYLRHSRLIGGSHFAGTVNAVSGNLLYHFGTGRVEPYLVGGLGVGRYQRESRLLGDRSTVGLAANAGIGLKGYLSEHVYIRPEFRIRLQRSEKFLVEPPFSSFTFTIGLGYRW